MGTAYFASLRKRLVSAGGEAKKFIQVTMTQLRWMKFNNRLSTNLFKDWIRQGFVFAPKGNNLMAKKIRPGRTFKTK